MDEYIYILSNPAMPGLVKVGKTTTHPNQRMAELHSTGVPVPFVLEFSACVYDCHSSEAKAHKELDKYRASKNREFFKISVKKALKLILPVIGNYSIDTCNSSHGVEEIEIWLTDQKNKKERELSDRQWTSYRSRELERLGMQQQLLKKKHDLQGLGKRPVRKELPMFLGLCWFAYIPVPLGWVFWLGAFSVFSEKTMVAGMVCIALIAVGYFANIQTKKNTEDFYKKNEKFEEIDAQIYKIECQLKDCPEISEPSIPNFSEMYCFSHELKVDQANESQNKNIPKIESEIYFTFEPVSKKNKNYDFDATNDFLKYRINTVSVDSHDE